MQPKYHYECTDCGAVLPADGIRYLCPACSATNRPGIPPAGLLRTVYPYSDIALDYKGDNLFQEMLVEEFLPLLPITDIDSWPPLRVGLTPLYRLEGWNDRPPRTSRPKTNGRKTSRDFELYLKDDSQNPTFSFKDRASALVSAWARENGIDTLIAASTGNAGSSLAGICAAQRQKAIIVVPAAAPLAKLTQILMYGAALIPVKGTYDDAFDLSVALSAQFGFYNRNTAYNPLTIEGKKTVAFELFEELGGKIPDRIFIPVGDGVILCGVCKGFEDLMQLGLSDRMPVLVAVQSAGSDNFNRNFGRNEFSIVPSRTLADSISVDVPRCYRMAADMLRRYGGETVTVDDAEITEASSQLARNTGIFAEPAAAAAFAGMLKYQAGNRIPEGSSNVVLLTGSGLKDLVAVREKIRMPEPVDPDPAAAMKLIDSYL